MTIIIREKKEKITLEWDVADGFSTKNAAMVAVEEAGQNIEEFSFVVFNGMYYPVSICTTSKEILISRDYIWLKPKNSNVLHRYNRKKCKPYKIINARISRCWNTTMVDDLQEFDSNFRCEVAEKVKAKGYMRSDCMVLFGCAMFSTMIPVFKLNAVDRYFVNSPSRWKLWKNGIKKYNPFTDEREYAVKGVPYTYEEYCKELNSKM